MSHLFPFSVDVAIIGAGMAGASLAAALAPCRSVVMIEAEDMAGYHATGRSAAFWQESYGGPQVQPLTRASEQVLASPDPQFSPRGFLGERSALVIGTADEAPQIEAFTSLFRSRGVHVDRLETGAFVSRVLGARPEWSEAAIEYSCRDIDVGALHQAYLRSAKGAGARLVTRGALKKAEWRDGLWHLETQRGALTASLIVNAAGAWADQIAKICGVQPLGIQPFRRTMVQVRLDADVPANLPLIMHVGGQFYFKGAGERRIWLTPHDETSMAPGDVAPDEMDVALAIDRLQSVVDWPIAAVERKWAGLRSFAPDRLPVFGADPDMPAFIWCAGQGGFGIQTAPAISSLLAAQLGAPPVDAVMRGLDPHIFSPTRFHA